MNLYPYNVGDDGFRVRCEQTQWTAASEIIKGVCAKYRVILSSVLACGDREGPFLDVRFATSQGDFEIEGIDEELRAGTFKPLSPTQLPMRTFMVTCKWRGAMHVHPIRTFVVESEAREYAKTVTGGDPVMYETFPDREPKKMKL